MSKDISSSKRTVPSYIMPREPSIDRRFRPCPERQVRLFDDIEEVADDESGSVYDEISTASDDVKATSAEGDGAQVYLRLRPVEYASTAYVLSDTGNTLVVHPCSEQTTTSNNKAAMEKHYVFSAIFDSKVTQSDVYEKCIGEKIKLEESFTVLTYGTSGSGKTFTLLGDDEKPGIVPRSLENIFTLYASNIYPHPALKLEKARVNILDDDAMAKECNLRRQILSACTDINLQHTRLQQNIRQDHYFESTIMEDVSVLIWISFVEIYNENVYDLLEPPQGNQSTISAPLRKNLKIIGNDGKVFVKGLTQVYVKNSLEALKLLRYGLQRVTYASTSINANSSRAHCIFFIDVLKYFNSGLITEISYKFCDLAGSERLDKTGNVGSRLKEAQRINTSLMILGRCLDAANNSNRKKNNELIPYRESKLTMVLQAALLGKEKLAMIVNVTPLDKYYEENLNVLGFSSIAKNIIFKQPIAKQTNSRFSFIMEHAKSGVGKNAMNEYVEQLLEENIFLRNENNRLLTEAEQLQTDFDCKLNAELLRQEKEIRNQLVDSFEKTLATFKEQAEKRLQQQLACQKRIHESELAAQARRFGNDIEELREELEEINENNEELPKKRRTLG